MFVVACGASDDVDVDRRGEKRTMDDAEDDRRGAAGGVIALDWDGGEAAAAMMTGRRAPPFQRVTGLRGTETDGGRGR